MEVIGDIKGITYVVKAEHSSDKSESAIHYDTRNYTIPSSEQRYNVGDYDKRVTTGELFLDHIGKLTDRMQFRIKNRTGLSRTATHDYLYHPERLRVGDGTSGITLLLASQLDALAAITDVNNSYDSKLRSLTNTTEISIYTRNELQPDKTRLPPTRRCLSRRGCRMAGRRQRTMSFTLTSAIRRPRPTSTT